MPRPLREDYEGAWHHVMNRGAGRSEVLAAHADKLLFLSCVCEGTQRYGVELHGYCLMSTHYHLLVRSKASRLSDAMRFVSGKFTRVKNGRDDRDGPLFRGRFTSIGIETDAHLIQASRYIHLNPLEAGLVSNAWDWAWSSAAAYLGLAARPDWLTTGVILDMFGPGGSVAAMRAHIEAGIDDRTRDFYARNAR